MRILKIVALVLFFYAWISFGVGAAGPKKVKVYLDAPNEVGINEEFSLYLLEAMRQADEADGSFEWEWVPATKAQYIITLVSDKNKLPVMWKSDEHTYNTCFQYVATVSLWDKKAMKTVGRVNQQVDCDPSAMGERAVDALLHWMGRKSTLAENK